MKYIITLCLLFISQLFAADTSAIDEYLNPESIDTALTKANDELSTLTLDDAYLTLLRTHYENNPTEILTGNFVKYYLVGTCNLHELIVIAQIIETNATTLIPLPGEPDYQSHNRVFFRRFLELFYSF